MTVFHFYCIVKVGTNKYPIHSYTTPISFLDSAGKSRLTKWYPNTKHEPICNSNCQKNLGLVIFKVLFWNILKHCKQSSSFIEYLQVRKPFVRFRIAISGKYCNLNKHWFWKMVSHTNTKLKIAFRPLYCLSFFLHMTLVPNVPYYSTNQTQKMQF